MGLLRAISLSILLMFTLYVSSIDAATFNIRNNCPYTVWAAALPGGGRQLGRGQSWDLNVPANTQGARIWGRTGCQFDASGKGRCRTGDCGGQLQCKSYGQQPNTVAGYSLNSQGRDFIEISLVEGFNVPMEFSPTSKGCTRGIRCAANINGQCPSQLKAPGGCNNPCTVFKTDQYWCSSMKSSCSPTNFSKFFKDRCPDAITFPKNDKTAPFTCPTGTNYRVVFCP